MVRFVSPPKEEFEKLRQPLTKGERLVFDFFDNNLPEYWEIYLQPHLNGLRPDFVLLNPKAGIAVFEVKDWNLDAMEYYIDDSNSGAPVLMGQKSGKTFSMQKDNPIEKIHRYKKELFDIYCPRLQKGAGFAVITAGVIFPFARDARVQALFSSSMQYRGMTKYPQYSPLAGSDALQTGNIRNVFPEGVRRSSMYMNDDLVKDLKNWLIEPDFSEEQRKPVVLDRIQRTYATTRTDSGYRRIKGSAGSGKSIILAARAAKLIEEGKEVLVVTYNITLLHYLMDVAVRAGKFGGRTRQNITWLNFHSFCKRICYDNGFEAVYSDLWINGGGKDVNVWPKTPSYPSFRR
jgi:hypothetical protein